MRTLEDFRGMKLRAPTRQTNKLLAALGATPVSMPVTGLADAMSKGVLDGARGAVGSGAGGQGARGRAFPHRDRPQHAGAVHGGVPVRDEREDLCELAAGPAGRHRPQFRGWNCRRRPGRLWDEQTAPARKLALDRGNTIIVVPAAELARWQHAAQSVISPTGWPT